MKTKHKFYREGDGYILATGECPKGFKGVVFVVWEGPLDSLKEGARMASQLKQLEEVNEIPGDWVAAFGQATGLGLVSVPKTKPTPTARRGTPLDEFVGHCAVGTDPVTAAVVSGLMDSEPEVSEFDVPDGYEEYHTGVIISSIFISAAIVCVGYLLWL